MQCGLFAANAAPGEGLALKSTLGRGITSAHIAMNFGTQPVPATPPATQSSDFMQLLGAASLTTLRQHIEAQLH